MRHTFAVPMLASAFLGLASCGSPPQTTEVVVRPSPEIVVPQAPMPPPPPVAELVPPPPPGAVPTVWQPGHWRYTGFAGSPWDWEKGQYVAVPPGAAAWVPGQWQQQDGGWVWRVGHWAA